MPQVLLGVFIQLGLRMVDMVPDLAWMRRGCRCRTSLEEPGSARTEGGLRGPGVERVLARDGDGLGILARDRVGLGILARVGVGLGILARNGVGLGILARVGVGLGILARDGVGLGILARVGVGLAEA